MAKSQTLSLGAEWVGLKPGTGNEEMRNEEMRNEEMEK